MSLQAVILAAGEGIRLRPLTQNRPKALIPVANKPIIEHTILSLLEARIRDIIVVVGYRKEQVMRHLARFSLPIMIVRQTEQLGTAHALLCAQNRIAGDVLVLPGDNYIDPDSIRDIAGIKKFTSLHNSPSAVELRSGDYRRGCHYQYYGKASSCNQDDRQLRCLSPGIRSP